jgi:glycogen phosphorylase
VSESRIAYFSMEIALHPAMPTYSGGLGMLAGDMLRAAADRELPMVAVTLLHRKGYFYQTLDRSGWQTEESVEWVVDDFLRELPHRAAVTLEGSTIQLRAWQYDVRGATGAMVPVYLLDTDLPENSAWHRTLTHWLYGGDAHYRLCQEVVLGMGGVKMLRALGHHGLQRFHMNEGHASLLPLALLDEQAVRAGHSSFTRADIEEVRRQCVFTTHTPVPAGHDQFPADLVNRVLGRTDVAATKDVLRWELSEHDLPGAQPQSLRQRGRQETCRGVAPDVRGVSHRRDHERCPCDDVDRPAVSRRDATYKRGDLVFPDLDRFKHIAATGGRIQIIYAGKAHPHDQGGKEVIQRIFQARDALKTHVKIAYMVNYDWQLAQLMTAGVDVWLNTPKPPLEASGTSGMKAALNGVPSLSILDGWWIEGCIEGGTGWAIGGLPDPGDGDEDRSPRDAASLYDKLERVVVPLFYRDRERFIDVMRHAIALNGSFFNTQRMVLQYVTKAYFR